MGSRLFVAHSRTSQARLHIVPRISTSVVGFRVAASPGQDGGGGGGWETPAVDDSNGPAETIRVLE